MSELTHLQTKPDSNIATSMPLKTPISISNATQTVSDNPALDNPAVARCHNAYLQARQAAVAAGKPRFYCEQDGEKAFCAALPPLSGHQNIQDFIACVAQGMLLGPILVADGSRLLYAAHVAIAASREQSKISRKPAQRKAKSKIRP